MSHGRKLTWIADRERKEDLIQLQIAMTRLCLYRHTLPNAQEVEAALVHSLWKLRTCDESGTPHMEMDGIIELQAAFEFIMERVGKRIVNEYKSGGIDID